MKTYLLLLLLLVSCHQIGTTQPESAQETQPVQIEPDEHKITQTKSVRNLYIEEGPVFHTEIKELQAGTTLNIVNQDKIVHHFTIDLIQEGKERTIEHYKSQRLEPNDAFQLILDKKGELRIVDIWRSELRTTIKID